MQVSRSFNCPTIPLLCRTPSCNVQEHFPVKQPAELVLESDTQFCGSATLKHSNKMSSPPAETLKKLSNIGLLPQSTRLVISKHANYEKRHEILKAKSTEHCPEKIIAFSNNCPTCHILYGGLMSSKQHEIKKERSSRCFMNKTSQQSRNR